MPPDGDPEPPVWAARPATAETVDDIGAATGAAPAAGADLGPGLTVDLAWQTVVVALVSLAVLVVLSTLAGVASTALTLIVVALFLALALDPVVSEVGRRLHLGRGWSTAVVLAAVTLLFVGFVALAGPQLVTESESMSRQLPRTLDSLGDLPLVGGAIRDADLPDRAEALVRSLPRKLDLEDADLGEVVGTVGFSLGAGVLAFFLLAGALFEGPRLIGTVRSALPAERREGADGIGRAVYQVVARYFAGSLLIALLNGIWVSVWALIAGVPLSPVLGVWAALTSLIPQIGGLMGFALVLLVSLTAGLVPTIVMAVSFLAFMLLTNHVLVPLVVGRAVRLSAPVTMLAAVGGFSVAGIVGALFAVPTFGAVKAVAQHIRGQDPTPSGSVPQN